MVSFSFCLSLWKKLGGWNLLGSRCLGVGLSGSLMQLSREGDCLVVPTVTGLELSGLFSSEFQLDYVAETEERQGKLVERVIYHQEAKMLPTCSHSGYRCCPRNSYRLLSGRHVLELYLVLALTAIRSAVGVISPVLWTVILRLSETEQFT